MGEGVSGYRLIDGENLLPASVILRPAYYEDLYYDATICHYELVDVSRPIAASYFQNTASKCAGPSLGGADDDMKTLYVRYQAWFINFEASEYGGPGWGVRINLVRSSAPYNTPGESGLFLGHAEPVDADDCTEVVEVSNTITGDCVDPDVGLHGGHGGTVTLEGLP